MGAAWNSIGLEPATVAGTSHRTGYDRGDRIIAANNPATGKDDDSCYHFEFSIHNYSPDAVTRLLLVLRFNKPDGT